MLGGMTAVEPPSVPSIVTEHDLDAIKELRLKHEQELRDFEEETRQKRHHLRKLKRELAKKSSDKPAPAEPPSKVEDSQERQHAIAQQMSEARARATADEAERERAQHEQFASEKAKLEEKLVQLRERRKQEELLLQKASSLCTAEDPSSAAPSSVPSCAPSAASSAAPSRCSSPTNSETAGRTVVVPVVPAVPIAETSSGKASGKGESVQAATPAAAPTPRKGGKGKGKGAPAPPPPTGITPRLSLVERAAARPSKFVNLYWKATQKPDTVDPDFFKNDPFLARLQDPGLRDPSLEEAPAEKIAVPELPETIFSAGLDVPHLPEEMLELYFKRSEAAVKLPQVDKTKESVGSTKNFIGDQKRIHMIGIMLQKQIMQNKEESNKEAILNIKRGVLQCDFNVVKLECLSVIRTVLRQHVRDGSPLTAYVQAHGEAVIWDLSYPEHHFLVHELSKVPQIDERLECMLFLLGFNENMTTCKANLETLSKALEALKAKRNLIRRFFVTAHRLGQSISQKQSRGFQLSTLEKLPMTKSTKLPHMSILHFCLALMSPGDAEELFTTDDITLLRGAKHLGTAKVCDESRELAQGLYGVKQICESGEYTSSSTGQPVKIERRRKTLPPTIAAASLKGPNEPEAQASQVSDIDTDDRFHEVMHNFVDAHCDEADDIAVECHKMLLVYKELALFFDDLNNVYPPPKDPLDKKLDLVDVFYRFAKLVPQHRQEVEDEDLRSKIY